MTDSKVLAMIRAAIAAKQVPKKSLARRCKVSRPQFSEMIHGDKVMPADIQDRLLKELGLEEAWGKLSSSVGGVLNG